jgi:hypothetical protein
VLLAKLTGRIMKFNKLSYKKELLHKTLTLKAKGKVKDYTRKGHEGPEVE